MTATLQSLGIDRLSIDDRLSLFGSLWDNIRSDRTQPTISANLATELNLRLADHRASPDEVVSWEEIRDSAISRMKS